MRRIQREGGLKKYDQEYPGGVCRGVAFTYSLAAYCSLRSEWCTKPGFLRRAQFYLLDHTHPFPEWARLTQEGSLFQNIA